MKESKIKLATERFSGNKRSREYMQHMTDINPNFSGWASNSISNLNIVTVSPTSSLTYTPFTLQVGFNASGIFNSAWLISKRTGEVIPIGQGYPITAQTFNFSNISLPSDVYSIVFLDSETNYITAQTKLTIIPSILSFTPTSCFFNNGYVFNIVLSNTWQLINSVSFVLSSNPNIFIIPTSFSLTSYTVTTSSVTFAVAGSYYIKLVNDVGSVINSSTNITVTTNAHMIAISPTTTTTNVPTNYGLTFDNATQLIGYNFTSLTGFSNVIGTITTTSLTSQTLTGVVLPNSGNWSLSVTDSYSNSIAAPNNITTSLATVSSNTPTAVTSGATTSFALTFSKAVVLTGYLFTSTSGQSNISGSLSTSSSSSQNFNVALVNSGTWTLSVTDNGGNVMVAPNGITSTEPVMSGLTPTSVTNNFPNSYSLSFDRAVALTYYKFTNGGTSINAAISTSSATTASILNVALTLSGNWTLVVTDSNSNLISGPSFIACSNPILSTVSLINPTTNSSNNYILGFDRAVQLVSYVFTSTSGFSNVSGLLTTTSSSTQTLSSIILTHSGNWTLSVLDNVGNTITYGTNITSTIPALNSISPITVTKNASNTYTLNFDRAVSLVNYTFANGGTTVTSSLTTITSSTLTISSVALSLVGVWTLSVIDTYGNTINSLNSVNVSLPSLTAISQTTPITNVATAFTLTFDRVLALSSYSFAKGGSTVAASITTATASSITLSGVILPSSGSWVLTVIDTNSNSMVGPYTITASAPVMNSQSISTATTNASTNYVLSFDVNVQLVSYLFTSTSGFSNISGLITTSSSSTQTLSNIILTHSGNWSLSVTDSGGNVINGLTTIVTTIPVMSIISLTALTTKISNSFTLTFDRAVSLNNYSFISGGNSVAQTISNSPSTTVTFSGVVFSIAGTWSLAVTDSNSNIINGPYTVYSTTPVMTSVTPTTPTTNASNGYLMNFDRAVQLVSYIFNSTSGFSNISGAMTTTSSTTQIISNLTINYSGNWTLNVTDSVGNVIVCPNTITSSVPLMTVISPTNSTTNVSTNFTLTFNKATSLVSYAFVSGTTTISATGTTITSTTITLSNIILTVSGTWTLTVVDSYGNSITGPYAITTTIPVMSTVSLTAPTTNTTNTYTLTFDRILTLVSYIFTSTSGFSNVSGSLTATSSTTQTIPSINLTHSGNWSLSVVDGNGNSIASPSTIVSTIPVMTALSPTINTTNIATSYSLTFDRTVSINYYTFTSGGTTISSSITTTASTSITIPNIILTSSGTWTLSVVDTNTNTINGPYTFVSSVATMSSNTPTALTTKAPTTYSLVFSKAVTLTAYLFTSNSGFSNVSGSLSTSSSTNQSLTGIVLPKGGNWTLSVTDNGGNNITAPSSITTTTPIMSNISLQFVYPSASNSYTLTFNIAVALVSYTFTGSPSGTTTATISLASSTTPVLVGVALAGLATWTLSVTDGYGNVITGSSTVSTLAPTITNISPLSIVAGVATSVTYTFTRPVILTSYTFDSLDAYNAITVGVTTTSSSTQTFMVTLNQVDTWSTFVHDSNYSTNIFPTGLTVTSTSTNSITSTLPASLYISQTNAVASLVFASSLTISSGKLFLSINPAISVTLAGFPLTGTTITPSSFTVPSTTGTYVYSMTTNTGVVYYSQSISVALFGFTSMGPTAVGLGTSVTPIATLTATSPTIMGARYITTTGVSYNLVSPTVTSGNFTANAITLPQNMYWLDLFDSGNNLIRHSQLLGVHQYGSSNAYFSGTSQTLNVSIAYASGVYSAFSSVNWGSSSPNYCITLSITDVSGNAFGQLWMGIIDNNTAIGSSVNALKTIGYNSIAFGNVGSGNSNTFASCSAWQSGSSIGTVASVGGVYQRIVSVREYGGTTQVFYGAGQDWQTIANPFTTNNRYFCYFVSPGSGTCTCTASIVTTPSPCNGP